MGESHPQLDSNSYTGGCKNGMPQNIPQPLLNCSHNFTASPFPEESGRSICQAAIHEQV
jgi:hypothetical protein